MASTKIADLKLTRVPERDRGEPLRRHGDDGEIEIWVAADPLRLQHAAIGERHRYVVGVLEDMIVGDDEAPLRIVNHAGSDAVDFARRTPP
jgi:hypothetical protein